MHYHWIFKNTFSSKLLHLNPIMNINISKKNEFKYLDNFGKLISINFENINYKKFLLESTYINATLHGIENDWKFPFPNNYIPKFYNKFKLDMCINHNNKFYFIKELLKIDIHHDSPYILTCKYQLNMNDNFIESRKIKGEMNYKTINTCLISNKESIELLRFVEKQIKIR